MNNKDNDKEAQALFEKTMRKAVIPDKDEGTFHKKKKKNKKPSNDLHGYNLEQAKKLVIQSIQHAEIKKQKHIVLIIGKGKNSPGIYSPIIAGLDDFLSENCYNLKIKYKISDGKLEICLENGS